VTRADALRAALTEIAIERGEHDDDPPDICEHCVRSYEECDADERFVPGENRCPGGVARRALRADRAATLDPGSGEIALLLNATPCPVHVTYSGRGWPCYQPTIESGHSAGFPSGPPAWCAERIKAFVARLATEDRTT